MALFSGTSEAELAKADPSWSDPSENAEMELICLLIWF